MKEKVLLTPAELFELIEADSVVLIDTRDSAMYSAGHLPDAINIHEIFTYLATSTSEGLAELRDKFTDIFGAVGLSGEETAVIYEHSMDTGFGQSCRGYVLLTFLGYPKVKILHGGYLAWLGEGRQTTTVAASPSAKVFPTCSVSTEILGSRLN